MSEKFPLSNGATERKPAKPYDIFLHFAELEDDPQYEGYTETAAELMRVLNRAQGLVHSGEFHDVVLDMPVRPPSEGDTHHFVADKARKGSRELIELGEEVLHAHEEVPRYTFKDKHTGNSLTTKAGDIDGVRAYSVVEERYGAVTWQLRFDLPQKSLEEQLQAAA